MLRFILICAAVLGANAATAQECPAFYRFVDFGLRDTAGALSRGGPILRGESLSGTTLLVFDETRCEPVRDIARDGHGNPIPVVSDIAYRTNKTGLDLTQLRVSTLDDTTARAEENARLHRNRLDAANTVIKDNTSLCVVSPDAQSLSCQVVSPYTGPAALVIYCDNSTCTMPVLALDARVSISASWPVDDRFWQAPETAGALVFEKVQGIHAFFAPLTSGF